MHKTFDEIRALQQSATELVEVGARYRHSKSGGTYIVQGFATIESTDELAVKYSPDGADDIEFVRPLSSFVETIQLNGEDLPRFEKLP